MVALGPLGMWRSERLPVAVARSSSSTAFTGTPPVCTSLTVAAVPVTASLVVSLPVVWVVSTCWFSVTQVGRRSCSSKAPLVAAAMRPLMYSASWSMCVKPSVSAFSSVTV